MKWEELPGWFIVPRQGQRLNWAIYDCPGKTMSEQYRMQVTGKVRIHGIEGVEITAAETSAKPGTERVFAAQLTETHCRFLAESHNEYGERHVTTFLDADEFLPRWGFGADNLGKETNLTPRGLIQRLGDRVTSEEGAETVDIVGRYKLRLGSKTFDTICVMDIGANERGIATEQYLDHKGRTILWRRFNRNDWAYGRYQRLWSDQLPDNQRLLINDSIYVHWYDCLTDYFICA